MRLIILAGFLGAGKTSILMPLARRIVDSCESGDTTKLVIIENEIGQVGVDNVFLDGSSYSSKEMFNGCVCCSLVGPLMECLADIEKNENPDWVILEATGLARPDDIAANLWDYYDENMNITTCIVVDASRWVRLIRAAGELVYDQITNANYVLINKTDIAKPEDLEAAVKDVESHTEGQIYKVSAKSDPEGLVKTCDEIIQEILSWE
ncbi:MAG: cobalamin biosynthesis protein P47K [Lachnospiraceae bacterium]|nr:cobalamin biosynthesis protein P47K [Lachnospiraceae bacterium]MBR3004409.1 cobalamin biosynthesis protein P47K [Lachnospiraceae bacterium]MBR6349594.1 cobalamin biosynthesis protein P47K [Lachnospiraceae bacterium]